MAQLSLDLNVRLATEEDANAVFALLEQFVVSYQPQREKFAQNFPKLIASPDAFLPVAVLSGRVVGYGLALRIPTLYANGDLWELQELMVAPKYRNQGVGSSLLDAVIAQAQAKNAVEVVVPSRRAGPYYLKRGFIETAHYYKRKLP